MKADTAIANQQISITVNGNLFDLKVNASETLAYTLRETLGLTATKIGCDHGACGACTVLIDGKPILSCITLSIECDGKQITTVEGLEDPKTGTLDALQSAFIEHTAFQCGFCTPGILMASKALLNENPSPTEPEIKAALSGHFCRCISHYHVMRAVLDAAGKGG